MQMRSDWIDALFDRLAVRYGALFTRQYDGIDLAAVKADWAGMLGGLSGASLRYGLANLAPLPPNAIQFRDICARAPVEFPAALAAPRADQAVVAAIRDRIAQPTDRAEDPAAVGIRNIERAAEIRPLTAGQRWVLDRCRAKLEGQRA
jgi:hypothetical protein